MTVLHNAEMRSTDSSPPKNLLRRRLLISSALAAGAATALSIARGAHAAGSDVLRVGLVGCGGRGAGAAVNAVNADPGARLVALADAFPEFVAGTLQRIKQAMGANIAQIDVPPSRCFAASSFSTTIGSTPVMLLGSASALAGSCDSFGSNMDRSGFGNWPLSVTERGFCSLFFIGSSHWFAHCCSTNWRKRHHIQTFSRQLNPRRAILGNSQSRESTLQTTLHEKYNGFR